MEPFFHQPNLAGAPSRRGDRHDCQKAKFNRLLALKGLNESAGQRFPGFASRPSLFSRCGMNHDNVSTGLRTASPGLFITCR